MPADPEVFTEAVVREALRTVDDPEVGMSIVDVGLVYRIEIADRRVHVELTMTSPACPLGDLITGKARRAIEAAVPEDVEVGVELVWDPPWTPDRMSDTARQTLGWPG
jgi:metal-sulfur cluster biosynthetic enzyme